MSPTPQRAHIRPSAAPTSLLEGVSRALFDALPMPAWLCEDVTFRLVDVNESAVRCYGFSPERR